MRRKKSETPRDAPPGDVGPFDTQGWKLHADGSRVHRWDCTIHDGEPCDGHCGPQRSTGTE